jgi:hypothetical protein
LIVHEAQSLMSVARWVLRRPNGVSGSDAAQHALPLSTISYGRDQIAFVWIFMGLTVLEIAVVEVIVPWPLLRWILLVVGVYGLLTMAGFVAANRTRPHILTGDTLRLRCGRLADIAVPLDRIATVSTGLRSAGYGPIIEGGTLVLGIAGSTNAAIILVESVPARAGKVVGEVHTVRFATDDPSAAAELIRCRLRDVSR